jgi:hypothetical protein
MPSNKMDEDIGDIIQEESTRGGRHPRKALTISQRRKMFAFVRMLADGKCDDREVANAIRALGPQEGSAEFQRLWQWWIRYRDRRS